MDYKEQFNKAAALMELEQVLRDPEGFDKEAFQHVAKGLQGLGRGALHVLNKFMPKSKTMYRTPGAGAGKVVETPRETPHFDVKNFDEEMLGRIGGITAGGGGLLGMGGLLGFAGGHNRGHRAGGRKALNMAGAGLQDTYGGVGGRLRALLGGANPGQRTLAQIGQQNFR